MATNALADMKLSILMLDKMFHLIGTRLVAVLADAGGGKSHLGAQLTAELPSRPAGILLHGRGMQAGKTLDDLAKTVSVHGQPVTSIEALLAAMDAAGQRARCRLPLVIDGLNEAEDPRQWTSMLATLNSQLQRFIHVLCVCTVRTGARRPTEQPWFPDHGEESPGRLDFANQSLPNDIQRIEIADFGDDTVDAIRAYFKFFRISAEDSELLGLLRHPLTLRIFCEVTNSKREQEVTIAGIPGSLTTLFEQYVEAAIERIAELAPRTHRYYEQDVHRALDVFGMKLWEDRDRTIPEDRLRSAIGADTRPWNESIVHMLEQEGIVLRVPGDLPRHLAVILVYDAFGGYLIASALLARLGRTRFEAWLKESSNIEA
jgi:hypothetical protein